MKLARLSDKEKVVEILLESFATNPTFQFLIRNNKRKQHYVERIASYAFDFAIRRRGVVLSNNEKGVALCFKYDYMKKDMIDIIRMVTLVIRAFAVRKIFKILRHTNYVEKTRPQCGDYYYFWFFGVLSEEQPKTSGRELAIHVLKKAESESKDIYAETTLEKNKRVYERFGFEVYKEWYNPENELNVWFMRKLAA